MLQKDFPKLGERYILITYVTDVNRDGVTEAWDEPLTKETGFDIENYILSTKFDLSRSEFWFKRTAVRDFFNTFLSSLYEAGLVM